MQALWDLLQQTPGALEYLILLAAAVGAFLMLRKAVWKPIKGFHNKVNSGMDTLLGYPAVLDPGSGKELKAATPALALRVDTLEDAMNKLIDIQEQTLGVNERILALEEWQKEHMQWSESMVKDIQAQNIEWQREHEAIHMLKEEAHEHPEEPPQPK